MTISSKNDNSFHQENIIFLIPSFVLGGDIENNNRLSIKLLQNDEKTLG